MLSASASTGQVATIGVTVSALPPALTALDVQPALLAMLPGAQARLVPSATAGGASVAVTYAFQSSNATVATVTGDGVVTAVGAGDASVTVTARGQGAGFGDVTLTTSVPVTVRTAPPAISDLAITPSTLALQVGGSSTLHPSVSTSGAGVQVSYAFASSNTNVATVSASGLVTGVSPGTATITATATGTGGGFSGSTLTTTVPVRVDPSPVALTALTVVPSKLDLQVGQSVGLTPTPSVGGANVQVLYDYRTSDARIATVTSAGAVMAVSAGTATISVVASGSGVGFTTSTITTAVPVTVTAPQGARVAVTALQLPTGAGGALQAVDGSNVSGRLTVTLDLSTGQFVADTLRLSLGSQDVVCQAWPGTTSVTTTATCQLNTARFDVTRGPPSALNGPRSLTATLVYHAPGSPGTLRLATDVRTVSLNNVSGLYVQSGRGVGIANVLSFTQLANGGAGLGTATGPTGVMWRGGALTVSVRPVDFGGASALPSSIPVTLFDEGAAACPSTITQVIPTHAAINVPVSVTFAGDAGPTCDGSMTLVGYLSGPAGTQVLLPLSIPLLDGNGDVVATSSAGVAANAPAGQRLAATVFIDNRNPPAPTALVMPPSFSALGGWLSGYFSIPDSARVPNSGPASVAGSIASDDAGVGNVRLAFEAASGTPSSLTSSSRWTAVTSTYAGPSGVPLSLRVSATDALGNRSVLPNALALPFAIDLVAPVPPTSFAWSVYGGGSNVPVTLQVSDLSDAGSGMATRPLRMSVTLQTGGVGVCPDTSGGDVLAASHGPAGCTLTLGRLSTQNGVTSATATFRGDGYYSVGQVSVLDRVGLASSVQSLTNNTFAVDGTPPASARAAGFALPASLTSGATVTLAPFTFTDNLDVTQAYLVADFGGFRIVSKQSLAPHPNGLSALVRTFTPAFDYLVTSTVASFGGPTLSLQAISGFGVDAGRNVSTEATLGVPPGTIASAPAVSVFGIATGATLTCDQCSGGSVHVNPVTFGSGLATSSIATLRISGPSGTFAAPTAQFYLGGLDNSLNAYWSLASFSFKGTTDDGVTRTHMYQATLNASSSSPVWFRTVLNGGSTRLVAYARDNDGHYFYVQGQGSITLVP
jgi:uncharacterized protein YjdB